MGKVIRILRARLLQGISPVRQPWNNCPTVSCSGSSETDPKTPRCLHFQTCQITKFGNWCIIFELSRNNKIPPILPELAQRIIMRVWKISPTSTASRFLPASFAWFTPPSPWVCLYSDNEYLAPFQHRFISPCFFQPAWQPPIPIIFILQDKKYTLGRETW